MKQLNLTDFLYKLARVLIMLIVLIALIAIIKWQVDAVYFKSTTRSDSKFTFIDEIKKTKNDILSINSNTPVESPVIEKATADSVRVTITENASVDEIADVLLNAKLITSPYAFKVLVNDLGLYNSFVAGTYRFSQDNKIFDTLLELTDTTYREFTIEVEPGDNSETIGKKLFEMGAIQSAEAFDAQCKSLGVENSFQVGSYEFSTPSKVVRIIEKLTGLQLEA